MDFCNNNAMITGRPATIFLALISPHRFVSPSPPLRARLSVRCCEQSFPAVRSLALCARLLFNGDRFKCKQFKCECILRWNNKRWTYSIRISDSDYRIQNEICAPLPSPRIGTSPKFLTKPLSPRRFGEIKRYEWKKMNWRMVKMDNWIYVSYYVVLYLQQADTLSVSESKRKIIICSAK